MKLVRHIFPYRRYPDSIGKVRGTKLAPLSIAASLPSLHGNVRPNRYFSDLGRKDDDDGEQRQKSAFLRAVDSNRSKNRATKSRQQSTPSDKPSERTRTKNIPKKISSNKASSRGDNFRSVSKKTVPKISKKLTLDEFFANLEKTKNNKQSMEPTVREKPKARMRSNGGEYQRPKPSYDDSNHASRLRGRAAPTADVGSFFDEINTLMERKQEDKQQGHGTTTRIPLDDLIPLRSSEINVPLETNGLRYTCSVESWDKYDDLVDEVIEGPKFLARFICKDDAERTHQVGQIIQFLRSKTPLVETHLPTLASALAGEISKENTRLSNDGKDIGDGAAKLSTSIQFREELNAQKQRFLNEACWTEKQYNVATGALVAIGSLCAKKSVALPLDIAWLKLKELGFPMKNKNFLHNYLYVASTFSLPKREFFAIGRNVENLGIFSGERINDDDEGDDEPISSLLSSLRGTSALSANAGDNDDAIDEVDVSAEVALCHDFLHEPTEQSTGIHVRRLVQLGRANEAEMLLDARTNSDDLRFRTYAPIFQKYLDQGDVSSAFKLFVRMKESENVVLQTETYIQMIACIAEEGFLRRESMEISGIEELSYSTKCGPDLFNILMSELAAHSIEISSASAKRLYNAFQRGFQGDDPKKNIKQLHLLESVPTNNDLAKPDELVVNRVQLDKLTGKCPRTGAQLRLINLDQIQKKRFQESLLYLVSSSYQERHRNTTKTDVAEKLYQFGEWLQNRKGKPFTAIIDGPNIAYYMQNFQQGTFNFHQIKFVVDALEQMGENVLVVLPKKYSQDWFTIQKATQTVKQRLSPREIEIRDDLIAKGKVFLVPTGSLDDYYWMYASVSMDEIFIPPDNSEGRWPGNRPMLISNDKLRDHKMSLLEPRLFRRWFSNFIVNFTFSAFVNDECIDKDIGFKTADFYSREIQGNSTDGNGTTWHFPVIDWDESEAFCIRIPN